MDDDSRERELSMDELESVDGGNGAIVPLTQRARQFGRTFADAGVHDDSV